VTVSSRPGWPRRRNLAVAKLPAWRSSSARQAAMTADGTEL
jgi:hypothetical protein